LNLTRTREDVEQRFSVPASFQLAIDAGVDVNEKDYKGLSPLNVLLLMVWN